MTTPFDIKEDITASNAPTGAFMRSFSLSKDADASNVTANFKDGVLQVHLPKSVKAKQKAMEIRIG